MSNGIIKHKVEQGDNIGDYVCHLDGWTTEPPTKPGWYWAKFIPEIRFECVIAHIEHDKKGGLQAVVFSHNFDLTCFTHWIGPLPVPEPPK